MSTSCKVIIGYTDHMGNWNTTEEYVRWSDGYIEAVLPILKEYKSEFLNYNKTAEYNSWKFEKITDNEIINGEYQYYLDISNSGIRCTIIKLDWDFYSKYNVDSYKIIKECTI